MTRKYSSTSVQTTLAADINNAVLSLTVATGTGSTLLGGVTLDPGNVDIFTIVIDPDTVSEEILYVTDRSNDTLTVTRGEAGTNPIAHTAGATIRHVLTSDDLNFYTAGVATANAAVPKSTVTTKGDLIVATGSAAVSRLGAGTNGFYLKADSAQSTGLVWAQVDALPSQSGNSGKYLTTDGSTASWAVVQTDPTPTMFLLMGA
jgi:hypothetical protein